MTTRIFHFYNRFRNGDNLMNLRFFKSNKEILQTHNIHIYYYFDPFYAIKTELEMYVDSAVLTLITIDSLPANAIEIWMGHPIGLLTHIDFEKYYETFYNNMYKHMQINKTVDSIWLEESYLLPIYNELHPKYKDLDIFILNNVSTANNFNPYNELNKIVLELSKKYKVATVCKVSDTIPSTMEDGLSLFDIGAIATGSKEIIAIVSGPVTALFNTLTKTNVRKWFFIHTYGCGFDFYSINNTLINTNNLQPIYEYYGLISHEHGT